jgi:MFS family permease
LAAVSALHPDASRLVAARALRGFADGLASVVLVAHLGGLGFSALETGAIVSATLFGSALVTLAVGAIAARVPQRSVLLAASAAMVATGLGFALASGFWPILAIALLGTLNPSAGDVTAFLPTEQALLARAAPAAERTALFARYNVGGALLGAAGALASGIPERLAASGALALPAALRAAFLAYAAVGLAGAALYAGLRLGRAPSAPAGAAPLARSRPVVLRLTALFALDAFGGGLVVNSILALWLFERFAFSLAEAGALLAATSVLGALSQLASAPLARRIGLVRTMVYTHVPANCFLVLTAFAPTAPLAVACLLARTATSSMDAPARQALVMDLVPPEEQAAAAAVTNVPRSLAAAVSPLLAGALLASGWLAAPLVIAGAAKLTYDFWLLAAFRAVEPPRAGA